MPDFLPPVVTVLKADIDDLIAKVEEAKGLIDSLGGTSIPIKFDIDNASIAALKAKAQAAAKAGGGIQLPVGFDINALSGAKLAAIAALMREQRLANAAAGGGSGQINTPGGGGIWGGLGNWHTWLAAFHIFGAQLASDTIGFGAFAIAATHAFGVVIQNWSTMATTYQDMNNQEKAASLTLHNFVTALGNKADLSEPLIFTTMNEALALFESTMGKLGGATRQGTLAMMDFFASLQHNFDTGPWQRLFGDGQIRQDMDLFGETLKNLLNLIPALVHDFNFLGVGALTGFNLIVRGLTALGNNQWNLVRFIALMHLAQRTFRYWLTSSGSGAMGPLGLFTSRLGQPVYTLIQALQKLRATPAIDGLFKNAQMFGWLTTIRLVAGGAVGAAAAFGLMAAGLVTLYVVMNHAQDATTKLISSVQAADKAGPANLNTWVNGAKALAAQQRALIGSNPFQAATDQKGQIEEITAAYQQQVAGVSTLRANYGYLMSTYHLTYNQAGQLAGALKFNMQTALTGNSAAARQARFEFQSYINTMKAAQNPESQLRYDMQGAANATLTLTDRVNDLTAAYNQELGPLAALLGDQVTWKNDEIALTAALKKSHGQIGLNTAAQRAAQQALSTSLTDTINLSQAILQQSGSMSKAQAPLEAMLRYLEHLHSKSWAVRQAIKALQDAIDALHSKSIAINVAFQASGSAAAIAAGMPRVSSGGAYGYAKGTSGAAPGWAWVGEKGPELVKMHGGESVIPSEIARGYARGAGGPDGPLEVRVFLDGKQIQQSVAQHTYQSNVDNGSRRRGGRVTGSLAPR